jgi:putative resolvase
MKAGKLVGTQIGREVRIPRTEIERLLGMHPGRMVVLYARVRGPGQKADRTTQLQRLQHWAAQERPHAKTIHYTDVGSGLRAARPGLRKVIRHVQDQQVSEVVVTYADRLTRFGFAYFQWWFAEYATRVVALDEDETKAPEQELVDDLIAIIPSFSGRLYGMRSHKQQALLACAKQVITGTEE